MLTGTTLKGRYTLLGLLGEGGMAVVYRAHDRVLDRDVAVKILRRQFAGDTDFVRRFRQEARNAASLAHPNIAAVFDTGIDGGHEFIVMQLVDGPNLEQVIVERGRLPVAEALRIALAVAEALQAAHARGIVHRDIKPGNILLTPDGSVRVVDFGIARALSDAKTTTPGLLMGSVQYCSPEQVLGEEVGPSSDVYSLGIVLYELLTGARPYDGPSPAAVALERLRQEPVPPSAIVGDLPPGIDALVMRALARHPGERFESAAAFGDAIRQWWRETRETRETVSAPVAARSSLVQARRPALPQRGPVPERRRVAAVGGGGVAAAAAAAGVGTAGIATRARPQLGHVVVDREPGDDDQSRVVGMALALAALVVAAIVFWSIVPRGSFGGGVLGATASPSGSVAAVISWPTPTPSSSPTPTPTPTPTPSATPSPTPTATVLPATALPPPVSGPTRSPSQTVARFYELVAAHQFSAAAQLWSPRMRAEYPPSRYINSRFAHTTRIVLHRNETISMSLSRGTAVVAVDLTEYRDNGPARRWIGRWDMVLTSSGWLMDEPHF